MATYYKTNGEVLEVKPKNKKWFTYKELQAFVKKDKEKAGDTMIEIVPLNTEDMSLVVNEEGKDNPGLCSSEAPRNEKAIELWRKEYPIGQFPNNNDECICGNALMVHDSELEK